MQKNEIPRWIIQNWYIRSSFTHEKDKTLGQLNKRLPGRQTIKNYEEEILRFKDWLSKKFAHARFLLIICAGVLFAAFNAFESAHSVGFATISLIALSCVLVLYADISQGSFGSRFVVRLFAVQWLKKRWRTITHEEFPVGAPTEQAIMVDGCLERLAQKTKNGTDNERERAAQLFYDARDIAKLLYVKPTVERIRDCIHTG